MSRRSLDMRLRMRRRSSSIFVSPGPRPPIPTPPAARPPTCRDRASPHPRRRGSRYDSWASSTCALPSRERACWAKMSRIRAVRSITLTLSLSSSWRSWPGESSPSQITVSASAARTASPSSVTLPEPMKVAGSGRLRRWINAVEHLRAGGLGEAGQLGQRRLGLLGAALGPDADEHDALEAQLPVLDLGDVGELGGQTPDAAQRAAILEVELACRRVAVGGADRVLGKFSHRERHTPT